jgi:hypothetical protein
MPQSRENSGEEKNVFQAVVFEAAMTEIVRRHRVRVNA